MSRQDKLNKSMDTLFPQTRTITFRCYDCGWEKDLDWDPMAVRKHESCPDCGVDLGNGNVHIKEGELCRVCDEPVVDGRWNYCSERCRDIASGVQGMFIWEKVREKALERDNYTCQECGLSKEMAWRGYWQSHDLFEDRFDDRDRFWELVPEAPTDTFHVDHIQRIADGGHPFEETNLQTLCKRCHTTKTAGENSNDTEEAPSVTLEDYIES